MKVMELFFDSRVTVAIAVENMAEDRHGPQVINGGADTDLNHPGVVDGVTVGDVCRGIVGGRGLGREGQVLGARLESP